MPANVYFAPIRPNESDASIAEKVLRLFEAAEFQQFIHPEDLVGLKIHFGEEGNENYIPSAWLKSLVEALREKGAKPFWTETSTLYAGDRANAVDHALLAHRHGFGIEQTGIPVVFCDGLTGRDEVEVALPLAQGKIVKVAEDVANMNALLVLSHATGHVAAGYGGAFKNLGMGLSSRKGKLWQHAVVQPFIDEKNCRGCGLCAKHCPEDAIRMVKPTPQMGKNKLLAAIDKEKCIGCGECLATCRTNAVTFNWTDESVKLQERVVEQAAGITELLRGKIGYLNFIHKVGSLCDCAPSSPKDVLIDALGILASSDPVALEKATVDLMGKRLGGDFHDHAHGIDFTIQFQTAKRLGLGSEDYVLIELEKA